MKVAIIKTFSFLQNLKIAKKSGRIGSLVFDTHRVRKYRRNAFSAAKSVKRKKFFPEG